MGCPGGVHGEGNVKQNKRDDLVSMTAIVAGTVVSVVVTIASLIMSDEESLSPTAASSDGARIEAFTDPRGPERGPTALEWEVIRTYKAIESMTATEPSRQVVDETLTHLRAYANDHPENPYVQELYLKGLRVARYYSAVADDEVRSAALEARFVEHAVRFREYEGTALESMRLTIQRLEQSCDAVAVRSADLVELAQRFPDHEEIASTLRYGLDAAAQCDGSQPSP